MRLHQHPHFTALFLLSVALGACILVYWNGLFGPLLLDDMSVLGQLFSANFSTKDILPNLLTDSGLFKRPVSMLSFIANGLAINDLFYWKLTNLLIHLACGILIYVLTHRFLRLGGKESTLLAAVITALWLLHPLQISTVLYTVQRMTQLSALFVFAAMLTYTMARERVVTEKRSWPLQLLTWGILFPLGVLSKENAVLFLAYVGLIELFYFNDGKNNISRKSLAIISTLGSLSIIAILFIKGGAILGSYATRDFTLYERLLTEGRVLVAYIGMLLIPAQSRMGFVHDDLVISQGLLDPWTTLPALFVVASLITLSFMLRKKHPIVGFGIALFFIGHAMESSIIALELMFEHRNYLPSYGLLLATGAAIHAGLTIRSARYIVASLAVAICIMLSYIRADTWSSMQRLQYYMEMIHPNSERLAMIKATQYSDTGQYDLARERLRTFDNLGSDLHRLEIDCLQHKKLDPEQFQAAIEKATIVNNYAALKIVKLANLGLDKTCDIPAGSFLNFLQNLDILPKNNNNQRLIMMYESHYLWAMGQREAALQKLHDTHALKKSNPIPLFLACEWMLDTDRPETATDTCAAALNIAEKDFANRYHEHITSIKTRLKPDEH